MLEKRNRGTRRQENNRGKQRTKCLFWEGRERGRGAGAGGVWGTGRVGGGRRALRHGTEPGPGLSELRGARRKPTQWVNPQCINRTSILESRKEAEHKIERGHKDTETGEILAPRSPRRVGGRWGISRRCGPVGHHSGPPAPRCGLDLFHSGDFLEPPSSPVS